MMVLNMLKFWKRPCTACLFVLLGALVWASIDLFLHLTRVPNHRFGFELHLMEWNFGSLVESSGFGMVLVLRAESSGAVLSYTTLIHLNYEMSVLYWICILRVPFGHFMLLFIFFLILMSLERRKVEST